MRSVLGSARSALLAEPRKRASRVAVQADDKLLESFSRCSAKICNIPRAERSVCSTVQSVGSPYVRNAVHHPETCLLIPYRAPTEHPAPCSEGWVGAIIAVSRHVTVSVGLPIVARQVPIALCCLVHAFMSIKPNQQDQSPACRSVAIQRPAHNCLISQQVLEFLRFATSYRLRTPIGLGVSQPCTMV